MTERELVTPSPRSAGQTGADRGSVFLLRRHELLNRQQEERPAYIRLSDRQRMNQSLSGQRCTRVCEWESVSHPLPAKHRPSSVVLEVHNLEIASTRLTRIF